VRQQQAHEPDTSTQVDRARSPPAAGREGSEQHGVDVHAIARARLLEADLAPEQ
jgi:hypothetical protein